MTYSRNSAWLIVVSALEASRTYAPFLAGFILSQSHLKGLIDVAVTVGFWAYTCISVGAIFSGWATRLYMFDSTGIRQRRGLLAKTDVFFPWSAVAAIEVHTDPLRGVAGCCKVAVRASAGQDSEIILDAVRFRVADEIQRVSRLPVSQFLGQRDRRTRTHPVSAPIEPVFVASQRDLIVMSLAYGRFALFIPFAVGGYMEFAAVIRLPDPDWLVARSLSGSLWSQLISLGAIILLAVGYGYAVTLLRFWRFRASVMDDCLMLEGGLLATQRRTIPLDGVIGLVLKRNALEVLMGRGRLALLTKDSAQAHGHNVVLPSLKMHEIRARAELLPGNVGELLAVDRIRMGAQQVWWIAGARVAGTILGAALILAVSGLYRYSVAASVVVVFVCLLLVNTCFTRLLRDGAGTGILYRRGVMWRSSYSVPLSEVRVIGVDTRPWDRWIGLRRTSLHYFAGGARRLFAWQSVRRPSAPAAEGRGT